MDDPSAAKPSDTSNDKPQAPAVTPDINTPQTPPAVPGLAPAVPGSSVAETPSSPPDSELPKNPLPIQQPKTGGQRKVLFSLIALVVLVAGGAAAYLVLHKSKTSPGSSSNTASKSIALLRVGVTQPFPSAFYPANESSIFPEEANGQIFEGLTRFQNGTQVVPNLAKSWSNPNSTTWVFPLISGVKFHDGNPLTAQAVKDSLDALQSTDYGKSYGSTIKEVTAKDASTVQITTTTPDPLLPSELANLWIYDTKSGKANDPINGTGPYTLKPGTQLTNSSLDLVAVDSYHGGTPVVKEILFKLYSDDKSVTADAQKGLLDIADVGSQSAAQSLSPDGFKPYADQNLQVEMIIPNTLKAGSPLGNLKVRQAIYEALDPTAVMTADGRGGTAATQLVPQTIPGYNPDIQRPKMDVAKAKTDLAAAGYPNGFKATFTYYSTHQSVAEEVQKEMAAIGVQLTLDPQTDGQTLSQKAFGGHTDMFYLGYTSSLVDSSDVVQPLTIDTPNYKNADLDKVYAQSLATFDSAPRLQLLQQMNKMIMDDVAAFPIFNLGPSYFAVKSNLSIQTDNLTVYSGIDFWNVTSN